MKTQQRIVRRFPRGRRVNGTNRCRNVPAAGRNMHKETTWRFGPEPPSPVTVEVRGVRPSEQRYCETPRGRDARVLT